MLCSVLINSYNQIKKGSAYNDARSASSRATSTLRSRIRSDEEQSASWARRMTNPEAGSTVSQHAKQKSDAHAPHVA